MGLREYFESFGDLAVTDKQSAQLAGIAEAYFPQRKRGYQRDLRAIHEVLGAQEDVIAGFACAIRRRVVVQIGLLVVTAERLLHVQAGMRHFRPKIRSFPLASIERIEFTTSHPDNTPIMVCRFADETITFSFVGWEKRLLPSVRRAVMSVVTAPIEDNWPHPE